MRKIVLAVIVLLAVLCCSWALADTEGEYTYDILADGTARITGYTVPDNPGAVVIPDTLGGVRVTSIAGYAFNDSRIRTIRIPNTVTQMDGLAFFGCSKDLRVMMDNAQPVFAVIDGNVYEKATRTLVAGLNPVLSVPEGIQAIGPNACARRDYQSISLPGTVRSIGEKAFEGASAPAFPLQKGIEHIGAHAFAYFHCTGEALDFALPATLKSIGDGAFSGITLHLGAVRKDSSPHGGTCEAANRKDETLKINMPAGLETLGTGVFENISIQPRTGYFRYECTCSDMAKRTVQAMGFSPSSVTSRGILLFGWPTNLAAVPADMFRQREGSRTDKPLVQVTLHNQGTVSVGDRAFQGCEKVTFASPCMLVTEGSRAFSGATVAGRWTLDEGVTVWPFSGADVAADSFPEHITTLEANALPGVQQDLFLHSGLTSIAPDAFDSRSSFVVEYGSCAELWAMENNLLFSYAQTTADDLDWLGGEQDLSWLNPEGQAQYDDALALMEAGKYREAIDAFTALNGFKDSEAQITECRYRMAVALMEAGRYQAAIEAFTALNGYSGSADHILSCRYYAARELLAAGEYDQAYAALCALSGYLDVDELLATDEYMIAEAGLQKRMAFYSKPGNIVPFGRYEQDNDPDNGPEAMEWIVLDYQADTHRALLISRYYLEHVPDTFTTFSGNPAVPNTYHRHTWADSNIRAWLNDSFVSMLFNGEERSAIAVTRVSTQTVGKSQGGSVTSDQLFLLSEEEVKKYFPASNSRILFSYGGEQPAYAWWLRSRTADRSEAPVIAADGSIANYHAETEMAAIRPALWLDVPAALSGIRAKDLADDYRQACALMESADYSGAMQILEDISWFRDSADLLVECRYQTACALLAAGDVPAAYAMFQSVTGYKDADALLAEDTKLVAEARLAAFRVKGSVVEFGHYEQDGDKGNGKEPIEWIVLDYDAASGRSLLFSKVGLDVQAYQPGKKEPKFPTWNKSNIRKWLNGKFVDNAFTKKEQKALVTVQIENPDYYNPSNSTTYSGGSATKDKVWLLSREEVTRYFPSDRSRMLTVTTNYARSQAKYVGTWWWLRSPGGDRTASVVNVDGSLSNQYRVEYDNGVVRPALWVDLNQLP